MCSVRILNIFEVIAKNEFFDFRKMLNHVIVKTKFTGIMPLRQAMADFVLPTDIMRDLKPLTTMDN